VSDVQKTIDDRQAIYGDYCIAVGLRTTIMDAIKKYHKEIRGKEMEQEDSLFLCDIVNKLCRLAATPSHEDSWEDVAGYSINIKRYYKEKNNANQ